MGKLLQLSAVLFFVWLLACDSAPKNVEANLSSLGERPEVKLSDLQGNPIKLSDYKGKIIFLNFWATWCKPCLQEMPSIANARNILGTEKFAFLLASPETKEEINNFKAAPNAGLGLFQLQNPEEINLVGLPTTYIYNKAGKLVFSEIGYRKWDSKENLEIIATANHQND